MRDGGLNADAVERQRDAADKQLIEASKSAGLSPSAVACPEAAASLSASDCASVTISA